jgi:hypothetical protein
VNWNEGKGRAQGVGDGTSPGALGFGGFAARYAGIFAVSLAMLVLAGCPKGNSEYNEAKKAEAIR